MHKYHNYHAILHILYTWFDKNELRLYLNGAKISSIGGGRGPPLNTPMHPTHSISYGEGLLSRGLRPGGLCPDTPRTLQAYVTPL